MAATLAGQRLTERHRTRQIALRAAFLVELHRLWPLLDPLRLDATAAAWLDLVLDLIIGFHQQSVSLSLSYYDRFRSAEIGEDAFRADKLTNLITLDPRAVRASLIATGPAHIKHQTLLGREVEESTDTGLVLVSGAASRHVLNGGRDAVTTAARNDKRTVGWMRVTKPGCCYFCAILASRGPVYKDEATALRTTERSKRGPGEKYHDHCVCTAEPMYRDTPLEEWPQHHRDFLKLWKDVEPKRGQSRMNAFRAAYNARLKDIEIPAQRNQR